MEWIAHRTRARLVFLTWVTASVIPPNAHAVVVVRAADYNAGRRLVVKAHSAAEQELLLRGTLLRKRSARSRPVHTCEG